MSFRTCGRGCVGGAGEKTYTTMHDGIAYRKSFLLTPGAFPPRVRSK